MEILIFFLVIKSFPISPAFPLALHFLWPCILDLSYLMVHYCCLHIHVLNLWCRQFWETLYESDVHADGIVLLVPGVSSWQLTISFHHPSAFKQQCILTFSIFNKLLCVCELLLGFLSVLACLSFVLRRSSLMQCLINHSKSISSPMIIYSSAWLLPCSH